MAAVAYKTPPNRVSVIPAGCFPVTACAVMGMVLVGTTSMFIISTRIKLAPVFLLVKTLVDFL